MKADSFATEAADSTEKKHFNLHSLLLPSFKGYKLAWLKDDIIAGIVVAALSIPVAMGYAQIAGLPPVYGLYASILPVLGYVLFCSSPQLIYGLDSAASAVTGSMMATLGIALASSEALTLAPVLSFFAAVFLLLFSLLKLGRFAGFISLPVMSGFITGISLSIMLGQVPKVMGVTVTGSGFTGNIASIFTGIPSTNLISLGIGAVTIAALLVSKRFSPKVPMALILLVLGTALTGLLRLDNYGVVITGTIPQGFPPFAIPGFLSVQSLGTAIVGGLAVALVIFADSLLDANSFAVKGGYDLDFNVELRGFSASNFVSAFFGSSPTSGSVSRTAASLQFKGKTQVVSIVSAFVIALVVLFLAGLLYYMPQPLLSGIIIAALVGLVDVKMFKTLWKRSRRQFFIWLISAAGVLMVGTLAGVLVGVVMSFIDMLARSTSPQQAFLGVIDGRDGYFDMARNKTARPARPDTVIYRFSAPLYFANSDVFKSGIAAAVAKKPRTIVVDASAISGVDFTAADDLKETIGQLDKDGISIYFAGATGDINDQLVKYGLREFVAGGHVKKTIDDALEASLPVHG